MIKDIDGPYPHQHFTRTSLFLSLLVSVPSCERPLISSQSLEHLSTESLLCDPPWLRIWSKVWIPQHVKRWESLTVFWISKTNPNPHSRTPRLPRSYMLKSKPCSPNSTEYCSTGWPWSKVLSLGRKKVLHTWTDSLSHLSGQVAFVLIRCKLLVWNMWV
jgi:hypothetical protein